MNTFLRLWMAKILLFIALLCIPVVGQAITTNGTGGSGETTLHDITVISVETIHDSGNWVKYKVEDSSGTVKELLVLKDDIKRVLDREFEDDTNKFNTSVTFSTTNNVANSAKQVKN